MEDKETIEIRAARGSKIFEEIRRVQKDAYIAGILPEYISLKNTQSQDLIDYLIHKEKINIITDRGSMKILGLEIITDERKILRLKPPHK